MLHMRARLVQPTRYLRPVERFEDQRPVKSTASTPATNDGFERLAAEDAEPSLMSPSAGLFLILAAAIAPTFAVVECNASSPTQVQPKSRFDKQQSHQSSHPRPCSKSHSHLHKSELSRSSLFHAGLTILNPGLAACLSS